MKLSAYLGKHGDASKLARAVGVKPMSVYRWRDGVSVPRRLHMRRLVRATGGQVGPADFYGAGN